MEVKQRNKEVIPDISTESSIDTSVEEVKTNEIICEEEKKVFLFVVLFVVFSFL